MDYENGHKNIFGLSVVLELKGFFIEEYKKGRPTFITDMFG